MDEKDSVSSAERHARSIDDGKRGAFGDEERQAHAIPDSEPVQIGVQKAEALHRVFGSRSKWFLYTGIFLAAYVYALDGSTTWNYLAFAESSYSEHSMLAAVSTAQGIIIAVGKPIIAKISDVSSRLTAYLAVLFFYILGYIVIASSHTAGTVGGGIIFYGIGYTGLQILTQIIIADLTTLKWRALIVGICTGPFIINAFVAGPIVAHFSPPGNPEGWRWGYGMFAILLPVTLSPLIVTLGWAEHKARKMGFYPKRAPTSTRTKARAAWDLVMEIDFFGLFLLAAAFALILLPFTLSSTMGGWSNGRVIAMITIGCCTLVGFALYEIFVAPRPLMPPQFYRNWTALGAAMIGFLDFISFYLTNSYTGSFVYVVKGWSGDNYTYFNNCQSVALTVFGIMAGVIMRFVHRYKWLQVSGLAIRLLGLGIMYHSRGAKGSTAELVITQIIVGMGGGITSACSQVAAQASVSHNHVAMVTALVLLWTELGGSIGSAVAGAIWTHKMPGNLAKHLPQLNETAIAELYGSITSIGLYPKDDPVRLGAIDAYEETMKILIMASLIVSAFPLLISITMPEWYLGDKQNDVDNINLKGETVSSDSEESEKH